MRAALFSGACVTAAALLGVGSARAVSIPLPRAASTPLSRAASTQLSISVQGNHFVNGAGQTIRLLGVNHPSSEYACVDGFGYSDGHQDAADAAAVASWNANAVRVPLNEDCWLGINGQPNSSQSSTTLTQAGYQQAVESYVQALNAHGLYAILDLHWSAPGSEVAQGQQPMPDLDHSVAFWQSVAAAFRNDPAVVFDVFNEPFDPTDPRSGGDLNAQDKVTWSCWESGGCSTASYDANGAPTGSTYQVAGMQQLVNAIRGAGATQPVLVGGLDYANDLSQWVAHAPADPLGQEAASFHNYMGKSCDTVACWNAQVAPVAASVPVVTGEFDENDYTEPQCAVHTPSTFDSDYMTWADQNGVSYLAWGWWVLSQAEKDSAGCSAFYLLGDYGGTPAAPNGTALHDHLLSLPAGGVTPSGPGSSPGPSPTPAPTAPGATRRPVGLRSFRASVQPAGTRVVFVLRSAQGCAGTLSGRTVNRYAVTRVRAARRTVSLGRRVRFTLRPGRARRVTLRLSRRPRRLLAVHHRLKVRITMVLKGATTRRTVIRRTIVLRTPRDRRVPHRRPRRAG